MISREFNIFLVVRGLTQKAIGEKLGLHKSTVSLLLSGQIVLEHRLDEIASMLKIRRRRLDSFIKGNQETHRNGARGKSKGRPRLDTTGKRTGRQNSIT